MSWLSGSEWVADVAQEVAKHGWPVFPCKRDKSPLTHKGFKDATTDESQIARWWIQYPQASIGVPTGAVSGFVVVDIDGSRGEESFANLTEKHANGQCNTLTSITGGGGRHLLFKCGDNPIGNTQSRLGPGIDTRGDGGYIIVPPSDHTSGNRYRWRDVDTEMVELPDWLVPKKKTVEVKPATCQASVPASPDGSVRRASAYLSTMDAAVEGCAGHDKLYAAATAMVHGFDLPNQVALDLLITEYNPRCSPPWELHDGTQRKDFERKVDQAAKQSHDQPRGWLANESGLAQAGSSIDANVEAILRKAVEAASEVPTEDEARRTRPVPHATVVRGLDDRLLTPPGAVGEICNWINSVAWKKQPILTLANVLAFWGAVVGRKVRDERNLRSNLYCLGVAGSGAGKDNSRQRIKQLCKSSGIGLSLLGGEDVSSDAGLLQAVADRPSLIFQWDEIGHMLAAANSKNAASYQRAIPVVLTKLYSSSGGDYIGKEYASAETERVDIDQPCACVYGTTVPSTLFDGITTEQIRDGFLGRMLVFQSDDDDPDPQRTASKDGPPAHICALVQDWHERRIDAPASVTGNVAKFATVWQIVVRADADAEGIFEEFSAMARRKAKALRIEATGFDPLWSRAEENARKLALVVASGCDFEDITIGVDIAQWACDLVATLAEQMIISCRDNLADSPWQRNRNMVLNAIRARGSSSAADLARACRGLAPRDRKEVLADLLETEIIKIDTNPTGKPGRPAIRFSIKNN